MVDWNLLQRKPLLDYKSCEQFKKKANAKVFIQARQGSTRFPNKIYQEINGAPMLYHTINAAKQAKLVSDIVVISPQKLPDIPEGIKDFVYDGEESDLVSRFFYAEQKHSANYIVRITSDCPLVDHYLIDFVIASTIGHDYGSNVLVPTFPDGMDVEVFSRKMLYHLFQYSDTPYDKEHVTTILRNDPKQQVDNKLVSVQSFQDNSYLKLSVDNEEDIERVRAMESLCQR